MKHWAAERDDQIAKDSPRKARQEYGQILGNFIRVEIQFRYTLKAGVEMDIPSRIMSYHFLWFHKVYEVTIN